MTDHEPPLSSEGDAHNDTHNYNDSESHNPQNSHGADDAFEHTGPSRKQFSKMLNPDSAGETNRQHKGPSEGTTESHNEADNSPTEKEKLIAAITGKNIAVTIAGTILPSLLMICWTIACSDRMVLLLLKHPVEALVEWAALLNIPIANYFIMSAISRGDLRFPLRNGILIGMATGTALLLCAFTAVAVVLGYPVTDINGESRAALFVVVGLVALGATIASFYLAMKLRDMREFRSARKISMLFSLGGLVTAILVLVGAEARPFVVRASEYNATSEITEERDAAVKTLQMLGAERDLRMECSDTKAAGIPGMFIKMDPVMQRQVYFLMTGGPFRDSKASDYAAMPDDYLRRHVVGAPVEKLSLVRSAMTGTVNGDRLTSNINWTFVLKNRNYDKQEARAELVLPHGAVINGLTQWAGEGSPPRIAHVGLASQGIGSFLPSESLSGADVTDLGRDRILVRCTAIPAQSETKVSISIAAPLALNDLKSASLTLPKFVDTNFTMLTENSLRLRSKNNLQPAGKGLSPSRNSEGEYLVTGNLKGDEMKNASMTIDITRNEQSVGPIASFDPKTRVFLTRSVVETKAEVPSTLQVVIDGSQSMKDHLTSVVDSLKKIPHGIATSVIIASSNEKEFGNEPMTIEAAIKKLQHPDTFVGGQDNLQSVVKAAGIAGESKNGAILWIHGPQAGLNKELYITAPYTATPKFFEVSVEQGSDDAAALFKNHREIGPFTTITRTNNIAADLSHFLAKWQPGGVGFDIRYTASTTKPDLPMLSSDESSDFNSICLKSEYERLIQKGNTVQAGKLAYSGNIITQDTGAVISFYRAPEAAKARHESINAEAPSLAGATVGTIDPQYADATYVTGVNTAGTVRVNNLANLEALLNIFANCFELGGLFGGGALILFSILSNQGFTSAAGLKTSRGQVAAIGLTMVVIGFACPGMINWLVASARDANLFS